MINRFKTVNDKMDNVTRELESIYIKKQIEKKSNKNSRTEIESLILSISRWI